MEHKPPVSMLNLLSLVQKRPVMYVGAADSARGAQLDRLEMLIAGYSLAVTWHGLEDPGVNVYSKFTQHLEERYGWNLNRGPIRAIRNASKSDADAWDNFWRLLWEFRDANR